MTNFRLARRRGISTILGRDINIELLLLTAPRVYGEEWL